MVSLVVLLAGFLIGARAARPSELHELDEVFFAASDVHDLHQDRGGDAVAEKQQPLSSELAEHDEEDGLLGDDTSESVIHVGANGQLLIQRGSGAQKKTDDDEHVGDLSKASTLAEVNMSSKRIARNVGEGEDEGDDEGDDQEQEEEVSASALAQREDQDPETDVLVDPNWKLEDEYHSIPAVCDAHEVKESQSWHSRWIASESNTQRLRDQIADDCSDLEKYLSKLDGKEEDIESTLHFLNTARQEAERLTEEVGKKDEEILRLFVDVVAKEKAAKQVIAETDRNRGPTLSWR